jgi:class 3 adenylate cyclase
VVDLGWAIQMARVIGTSMARIAEAETGPTTTGILLTSGDSIIDADRFAAGAGATIPAMARLLEYVWRRHLQAATRRAMLTRTRGQGQRISQTLVVGFADMVGFTALSQHLDDGALAAVVGRFEELAHDTVVARGGRVVKMIGDEAMFVVEDVAEAAEIGVGLAEAYADDDLLSDVRVALAVGDVLMQEGDFYGPVVNLASRLVGVANPGTVLVSEEFRNALVTSGVAGFATRPLRARTIKDIGRVQVWKLNRAGAQPGADRHRNVRWERLGEVLRELEDLRDRGERLVLRGTMDDRAAAPPPHPAVPPGAVSDPTVAAAPATSAPGAASTEGGDRGDVPPDGEPPHLRGADGSGPSHAELTREWGFGE